MSVGWRHKCALPEDVSQPCRSRILRFEKRRDLTFDVVCHASNRNLIVVHQSVSGPRVAEAPPDFPNPRRRPVNTNVNASRGGHFLRWRRAACSVVGVWFVYQSRCNVSRPSFTLRGTSVRRDRLEEDIMKAALHYRDWRRQAIGALGIVFVTVVCLARLSGDEIAGDLRPLTNASGAVQTVTPRATFDADNPFFRSLGTNGRACST